MAQPPFGGKEGAGRHSVFLTYWLDAVVKPNLAPLTYVSYEGCVRLYIAPHLGPRRLDRLTVRDVREWLTKLATVCQCCAQGKDSKRAPARRGLLYLAAVRPCNVEGPGVIRGLRPVCTRQDSNLRPSDP